MQRKIPTGGQETPSPTIERLERELAHVSEQCRISHAMAMCWRQRALSAEEACRRLQQKLQRREHVMHKSKEPIHGDGLHDALDDLAMDEQES